MISSFILHYVRKDDTRLFDVREVFKRILLLGFRAHIISAYQVYHKKIPATDAGPLLILISDALIQTEACPVPGMSRNIYVHM